MSINNEFIHFEQKKSNKTLHIAVLNAFLAGKVAISRIFDTEQESEDIDLFIDQEFPFEDGLIVLAAARAFGTLPQSVKNWFSALGSTKISSAT